MNRVTFIGNCGSDAKVFEGKAGKVASVSLAITEKRGTEVHTEWQKVKAFGKSAEILEEVAKKGVKLFVEGKMSSGSYENKDGVRVYTNEAVAHLVYALSFGDNEEEKKETKKAPKKQEPKEEVQEEPEQEDDSPVDDMDDDKAL